MILAIQLFGLGLLAYQAKRYHDNLFHLTSTLYRWIAESRAERSGQVDTLQGVDDLEPR
jgi:hypothetical protein